MYWKQLILRKILSLKKVKITKLQKRYLQSHKMMQKIIFSKTLKLFEIMSEDTLRGTTYIYIIRLLSWWSKTSNLDENILSCIQSILIIEWQNN